MGMMQFQFLLSCLYQNYQELVCYVHLIRCFGYDTTLIIFSPNNTVGTLSSL